ncbi:MAG: tyrosine-type recombinase/integrase [Lachnospiraceae bacterium]|nr:tyrosine-type recombinase/integrase [Lachnospiraceae bacterium]
MQRNQSSVDLSYHEEQDKKNTLKMREVLATLPGFCRQYFRGIADVSSARTRLGYAYDLRTFFIFIHENNTALSDVQITDYPLDILDRITREDIEEYVEYITLYSKEDKEFSNDEHGKARKLSALRSMYLYFYRAELIKTNPASLVNMPKMHEKAIIRLEPDEVARMLDEVEDGGKLTKSQMKYHHITKSRDVAMITLLLGTGIRVSECVGLDLTDIDFNTNGLKIHRKGGYETLVYFGSEVEQALREYLTTRSEIIPVTGHENALFLSMQKRRISVRAVENLVKKYAQTVTTLKHITPHKLRSTFGTNLYRETGDIYLVADVLGHKDVNTTRRHYAAIDDENRRKAANKVHLRDA